MCARMHTHTLGGGGGSHQLQLVQLSCLTSTVVYAGTSRRAIATASPARRRLRWRHVPQLWRRRRRRRRQQRRRRQRRRRQRRRQRRRRRRRRRRWQLLLARIRSGGAHSPDEHCAQASTCRLLRALGVAKRSLYIYMYSVCAISEQCSLCTLLHSYGHHSRPRRRLTRVGRAVMVLPHGAAPCVHQCTRTYYIHCHHYWLVVHMVCMHFPTQC
jgi:hypothetical protein